MFIGFDISQAGGTKAGCGYFADAMARSLLEVAPENRYALYPSFGDFYFDPLMPVVSPYRGARATYGPRFATRDAAARFWNHPGLEKALGSPHLIHANNYWCPTGLARSRLVYTCYDFGFAIEPGWTTETNRVGCFDGVFRSAVAADWILAISSASRSAYLDLFPHFPAERIRVIHPCSRFDADGAAGVAPPFAQPLQPGRFWLCVGTIEPRKNQERLANAYSAYLAAGGSPMPLVFAGGKGWLMDDFAKRLEAMGVARQVILTGYIPDTALRWLYTNCFANLYPSLYEGFGLPVLEGMQHGAPSIVSDTSSMPEVAGDAAILLDPLDTGAWTAAMLRLSRDPAERARLSAAAKARASQFDRRSGTRALLALYEEALASPRREAHAA